jgi:hypothetical protein
MEPENDIGGNGTCREVSMLDCLRIGLEQWWRVPGRETLGICLLTDGAL